MFERFSKQARSAVALAYEEARVLRSERIEAGHLVLALASDKDVGAAFADLGCEVVTLRSRVAHHGSPELDTEALASLGIDIDQVRASVASHFGEGALDRPPRRWRGGHIPLHRSAKKSLECALREAVWLKSKNINLWHMLLGVIRAEPSTVDDLIGADSAHQQLRQIALRKLSEPAA